MKGERLAFATLNVVLVVAILAVPIGIGCAFWTGDWRYLAASVLGGLWIWRVTA